MIPFATAYPILQELPRELTTSDLHVQFSTYNKSRKYYDFSLDAECYEPVPTIDELAIFQDALDGSDDFLPFVDWFKARKMIEQLEYDLMRGVV